MATGNASVRVSEGIGRTLLHAVRDPTYYPFFKAADFWLGAIGFGITLVGFWIAAKRLKEVEIASNAAAKAVKEFKLRINRYDAASDVSSAKSALMIVPRTVDASDWRTVGDVMTEARHTIVRVTTLITTMDVELSRDMANASVQLEHFISAIETSLVPGQRSLDSVGVKKVCRAAVEVFLRAQVILQENA